MTVATFQRREYLTIESGIVRQQPYPFDRHGTRVFWLRFHHADGTEHDVWDGESHAEAIEAAASWGLQVIDRAASTGNVSSERPAPLVETPVSRPCRPIRKRPQPTPDGPGDAA